MSNLIPNQWNDGPAGAKFGDGISRPLPKARTKAFRLEVKPVDAPLFIWTINAESMRKAMSYAKARWPGSTTKMLK